MSKKAYRGKEIVVTFDKDTCIHAGECVRGLPGVFDVDQRPWVQPDNATADQVRAVVAKCPTEALQIQEDGDAVEAPTAGVTVTVLEGGPLMVDGPCVVRSPSGDVLKEGEKTALCRCGHSANKPFCDGAHKAAGLEAE